MLPNMALRSSKRFKVTLLFITISLNKLLPGDMDQLVDRINITDLVLIRVKFP